MVNDGHLSSRGIKSPNRKSEIRYSHSTYKIEHFYNNAPISSRWHTTKTKNDGKLSKVVPKRNQLKTEIRNIKKSTILQPTNRQLTLLLDPYKVKSCMKSTKPHTVAPNLSRKASASYNNALKASVYSEDTAITRLQKFIGKPENAPLIRKTKTPTNNRRHVEFKSVPSSNFSRRRINKLKTTASENTLKNTDSPTYTTRPSSLKGSTVTKVTARYGKQRWRKKGHLDAYETKNVFGNRLLSANLSRHKQSADNRMQEHSKYIDRNVHNLKDSIKKNKSQIRTGKRGFEKFRA